MPDEITFKPRTAANRHVEDQATIDALRARVAELEAQIAALDCRLVGRVADLSGSHCPADRPCDRCVAERRIEELSHAYAVQGLALEDLTAERDRYREALEAMRREGCSSSVEIKREDGTTYPETCIERHPDGGFEWWCCSCYAHHILNK